MGWATPAVEPGYCSFPPPSFFTHLNILGVSLWLAKVFCERSYKGGPKPPFDQSLDLVPDGMRSKDSEMTCWLPVPVCLTQSTPHTAGLGVDFLVLLPVPWMLGLQGFDTMLTYLCSAGTLSSGLCVCQTSTVHAELCLSVFPPFCYHCNATFQLAYYHVLFHRLAYASICPA